jgi:hypothetical protein
MRRGFVFSVLPFLILMNDSEASRRERFFSGEQEQSICWSFPAGRCRMRKNQRLAIIGGDAAGMSAAVQAKRRNPELDIIVFERGPHTSYSA